MRRSQPWYRNHVEVYIFEHKDLRLADYLPETVDRYLIAKSRLPSLESWQFRQIADALRLRSARVVPQLVPQLNWIIQDGSGLSRTITY